MPILVTGGAGFIGSHLVGRLLSQGNRVVVLDNFNDFYNPKVKRQNIEEIKEEFRQGELEVIEGDLRDAELVDRLFADYQFDLVHHLAAMAGVRASIENPAAYFEVNVLGTVNLLESAVKCGKPPIVFASSSSVYGGSKKIPFREDNPVSRPISPYAASKKAAELACHTYHHLHRLDITCLRFFTVYGPRQRPEMAIHRFTRHLTEGRPIPMFGDGSTSRDYTYIDDVVDGAVAAGERCNGFAVINLGNSSPVELRRLIDILGRTLKVDPTIEDLPMPPGDVPRTWADITLAEKELGYKPSVQIEDGIERFVEWFYSHR